MTARITPAPAGSRVTSSFRSKTRPTHDGTDYAVVTGTPIKAPEAGVVELVKLNHPTAGNYVQMRLADGTRLTFLHLSAPKVKRGNSIEAGHVIGLSGSTGNSTGPHLHFGVKVGANYVNPVTWLKQPQGGTAKPPTSSPTSPAGVLRLGVWNNPKVAELQRVLNAWYPNVRPALVVDGDYGPRTQNRVRYFQGRARLVIDGIAGPKTLGALSIK